MGFDAAKWPNAVTIGRLIEQGMPLGAHCHKCGNFKKMDLAALPIDRSAPVPSLDGRFPCTRCGSRQTSARPEFAPMQRDPNASLIVR